MMRRPAVWVAAACMVLCVTLAFVGRASFGHSVIVFAFALYAGAPLLLLTAILFFFRRRFVRTFRVCAIILV